MSTILTVNRAGTGFFLSRDEQQRRNISPARTAAAPRRPGRDRVCRRAPSPQIARSDPPFRRLRPAPPTIHRTGGPGYASPASRCRVCYKMMTQAGAGLAGPEKGFSSRQNGHGRTRNNLQRFLSARVFPVPAVRRKSYCSRRRFWGLLQCSRVCQTSVIQLQCKSASFSV